MGYRLAAVTCMLAGYCYFGNFGTIYFRNVNMGLMVLYLGYWLLCAHPVLALQSVHYLRLGSRTNILRHILWQQATAGTVYMTCFTVLFIGLSLLYAQPFTYGMVLWFYAFHLLGLLLLLALTVLVKLQYGNTAGTGVYLLLVGLNVLISWLSSGAERWCFLAVPFVPALGGAAFAAYLPIGAALLILYITYRKRDLKL